VAISISTRVDHQGEFVMIYPGIPDDQNVLAAIGKIAIRHGQLDHALRMMVRSLTGVSIVEALDATVRQTSGPLRDRVKKLARKRFGESEVLVKLEAMLERSRRATERRNNLLHGLWAVELDVGPVMRTEGNTEFTGIPSAAELNAVAQELYEAAHELNRCRLDGFLTEALKRSPAPPSPP
jgi:hypothetical protein